VKAMVIRGAGRPLGMEERPEPRPAAGQVLLDVSACAICRTDLHLLDGELPDPSYPIVPGHQIVGVVREAPGSDAFRPGDRVGVPWLGYTCGRCAFCTSGRENLCDNARFTGCHIDGGFAEACVADARYCFPLPEGFPDEQAAPLLCAGLIGWRTLRAAGDARRLGFYGFGAAAHILIQVARHLGREVYAFTRRGDTDGQAFARSLGAAWAGASGDSPPEELDAALIFAPVGSLVPEALAVVKKGGTVVCGGIHMSDIPSFPYDLLWGERSVRSVANLTRKDGEEFLALAPRVPVVTRTTAYPLEAAPRALEDLRSGRLAGAGVIVVRPS